MTLLSAIETEVSNLSTSTRFLFAADREEANASIMDKVLTGEFPVCLLMAFDIQDVRINGIVKSKSDIRIAFLTRLTQLTPDLPMAEIDEQAILPMRNLAREFINRLDKNDIISEAGIESVTYISTHGGIYDAHLYGSSCEFTVNFEEGISLCPPH